MESVIEEAWECTNAETFYLKRTSDTSGRIHLTVHWDELEKIFHIYCNDFLPKVLSTSLGVDAIRAQHEQLALAHPELQKFLPNLPQSGSSDNNTLRTKYDFFPSFFDTR